QYYLVRISARPGIEEAYPHSGSPADLGPESGFSSGAEGRGRDGPSCRVVRFPGVHLPPGEGQLDPYLPRLSRSQEDPLRMAAPGAGAERPAVRTRGARTARAARSPALRER